MSLNLFIIGPSGSGKSTQAKLIAQKYNLTHFSTGQIFRDEIDKGTPLGLEANKYIEKGLFCPDELVLKILFNALDTVNFQNFIVDGTPRLPGQSKPIEQELIKNNQKVTALIHLTVTFEEIWARRLKLGKNFQDKNRSDNTPQAIAFRQKEYENNINPILDFYRLRNQLIEVDGNRPIDPIFQDICQKIDQLQINNNI